MRNVVYNMDCMKFMKGMGDKSVDFVLTDIPYGEVNERDTRTSTGFRKLNKSNADTPTFTLENFVNEIARVARSGCVVFCGIGQISNIYTYISKYDGTSRLLVLENSNPSPINCQHVYLSSTEFAVWHRFHGGTFNAFYKGNVFRFPAGQSKQHPTMKNVDLIKDLIRDNTNEGDTVFDPCVGSGTTGIACMALNRNFIGCEIDKDYYETAIKRLKSGTQAELF